MTHAPFLDSELLALAETNPHDFDAVNAATAKLEQLLIGEPVNEADDPSLRLGKFVTDATTRLYEVYETNLELNFAQRVLNDSAKVEDYPLYHRFERLVAKEVELAGIKSHHKILFVGSGPFPISPILIHELSGGAKVDCFDLSEEACDISTAVIDKLELDTDIHIKNLVAEHARLPTIREQGDMGGYDVVVVALLAQPKKKILHKIWQSVGPYQKYIVRNSESNRRFIYAGVDPKIMDHRHYEVIGSYHAGIGDPISGTLIKSGSLPMIYKI